MQSPTNRKIIEIIEFMRVKKFVSRYTVATVVLGGSTKMLRQRARYYLDLMVALEYCTKDTDGYYTMVEEFA